MDALDIQLSCGRILPIVSTKHGEPEACQGATPFFLCVRRGPWRPPAITPSGRTRTAPSEVLAVLAGEFHVLCAHIRRCGANKFAPRANRLRRVQRTLGCILTVEKPVVLISASSPAPFSPSPWPAALVVWSPGSLWTAHAHHSFQVCVALTGTLRVRGHQRAAWRSSKALLVPPDVEHEIDARGAGVVIAFL